MVRPRFHPPHASVMTCLEPLLELEPGGIGRIGTGKPARGEAEPACFSPYCVLKALHPIHGGACTPPLIFFVGISVLRSASQSAASDRPAIEAIDLTKDFNETRAVDGVSLAVPAGTIFGLLGPNGAGKTTLLRMLIGIIDPSSGTRCVLGYDRPLQAAAEVGYLPEERGLYPAMTARDAIAFMGALRGLPIAEGRRRADELLTQHDLSKWARKPIRTLSKGMAQTVQLLGTIVHRPRLIFLDEPCSPPPCSTIPNSSSSTSHSPASTRSTRRGSKR